MLLVCRDVGAPCRQHSITWPWSACCDAVVEISPLVYPRAHGLCQSPPEHIARILSCQSGFFLKLENRSVCGQAYFQCIGPPSWLWQFADIPKHSLSCRWITKASAFIFICSSPCECLCTHFPLQRASVILSEVTQLPHLTWITSIKNLSPVEVSFWVYCRLVYAVWGIFQFNP